MTIRLLIAEDQQLIRQGLAALLGDEDIVIEGEASNGADAVAFALRVRPDLVLMDRAVDDEAKRHPSYDVVPPPKDFVPESGALWKATRSSTEKGKIVWVDIVTRITASIDFELGQERQIADGY